LRAPPQKKKSIQSLEIGQKAEATAVNMYGLSGDLLMGEGKK
jgi:hypothetical protein